MKKKWWKRRWVIWCVWMPLGFLGFLIASYAWQTWREKKKWEATKQMVINAGQSLDYRDYLQPVSAVEKNALESPEFRWLMNKYDPDDSGGLAVLFGVDFQPGELSYVYLNWDDADVAKGLTLSVAQDFENEDVEVMSNEQAARAMLDSVAAQSELIDKVDALLKYSVWQDPAAREHDNPINVDNRDGELIQLSLWQMRCAAMHFQLNESVDGFRCLERVFRAVELAHAQRSVLGVLVEITVKGKYMSALWQGLVLEQFNEEQLRKIDAVMKELPLMRERMIDALYVETAFGVAAMRVTMRDTTPDELEKQFSNPVFDFKLSWTDRIVFRILSLPFGYYRNQRLVVECRYAALQEFETMEPKPLLSKLNDLIAAEASDRIDNPTGLKVHIEMLAEGMLNGYGTMLDSISTADALWNVGRSQVAVARFKLTEGCYPSGFSELVPNYLNAVPADPFDGKPLRWTTDESGKPLIYSIGPDLTDDGGAVLDDDKNGDIRWLMTVQGVNDESGNLPEE